LYESLSSAYKPKVEQREEKSLYFIGCKHNMDVTVGGFHDSIKKG
jgi:hypothetical protein